LIRPPFRQTNKADRDQMVDVLIDALVMLRERVTSPGAPGENLW